MSGSASGERHRLLFVCTGNTCRSPLAEALGRAHGREQGRTEIEWRSAGTFAAASGRASPGALEVGREEGLDLAAHRSSLLSSELLDWADLIVCMGEGHLQVVRDLGAGERACLMTEFLPPGHPAHGRSVPDPVGAAPEVYRETFALLRQAVHGLLDRLDERPDEASDDASSEPPE